MRLIDADVIIARCDTFELKYELSATEANRLGWLKEMIKMMPTIDPERRGKWIPSGAIKEVLYMDDIYRCSACDFEMFGYWKYCPHCGAKMDVSWTDGDDV